MSDKSLIGLLILFLLASCSTMQQDATKNSPLQTAPNDSPSFWRPQPLDSFQVQFSGKLELQVEAHVFELDAFDTDAEVVEVLHQQGKKVICYIDAGTVEDWRPDVASFPPEVIGKVDVGWPGENWLNIRALDALLPILEARVEMCASKGFDGVEFDNLDGFQNDTGFDLMAAEQLMFNRALAEMAHKHGLAAGLKNDPDQITDLEPWFDFVILEGCFEQGWCSQVAPFTQAEKAVFDIEYTPISPFCESADEQAITLVQKKLNLNEWVVTCQ